MLRPMDDEDRERIRQLFDSMNARVDVDGPPDNDRFPLTSVLFDRDELETMLAWARHVETYNLGYTGHLIEKMERAQIRLLKRLED